jgi:hypothetical protein
MTDRKTMVLLVGLTMCGAPPSHASVHPYAGVGATVFSGAGVPGTFAGFGTGLGVDFAHHPFALGLRAELNYLATNRAYWVQIYTADFRVFFASPRWRLRPYADFAVGGGGAGDLAGSPGYAWGAGGGLLFESNGRNAIFLDLRNIELGHMEGSGPTMLMIRVGLMKGPFGGVEQESTDAR